MESKKYKIQFLPLFEEDLTEIVDHMQSKLKNPAAAYRFVNRVEQAILRRSENPEAFEPYKSRKEREYLYYRIYIGNFIVFYVVIDDVMEVRRILYKRRNIKKHL